MRCPSESVHARFADGELPEDEARELMAHLEACADCRDLAAALKEENRVLIHSLQGIDWCESEQVSAGREVEELVKFGRLTAAFLAVAILARTGLNLIAELELPASLNWLFPMHLSGQLNWLASGFFYLIGEGGATMTTLISNVGLGVLGLFVLSALFAVTKRFRRATAIISLTALMLALVTPSYSMDIRKAEKGSRSVTVASGETVNDTLVAFGDSITISGTITGDLIAFARRVDVRGTVQGNIVAFAQNIDVTGNVGSDLFAFAQSVQANGSIGRDLYGFGSTVAIGTGGMPEHDATIYGANVNVDGNIGNDLTVHAGALDVGSKITRNLHYRGGQLSVHDPAVIGGNLDAVTNSEKDTHIDASVSIAGKKTVEYSKPKPSRYMTASFYFWQIIKIGAAFVTGLLLFWLFPRTSRVSFSTSRTVLTSGGIGFLAAVAAPVAALILAITLVGFPIALVVIVVWLLGLYLAKIVVARYVGEVITGKKGETMASRVVALLVGLVIVVVAVNLPFIGGIINFLLFLIGLGALVVTVYRASRWQPAARQADSAPLSLP
jgi:hypothetical protein